MAFRASGTSGPHRLSSKDSSSERSGSCHSPLHKLRALEPTILISHQPPAPESHIHSHERGSLEQNKTQRIPDTFELESRDLGNAVPGKQAKLFHRSRSHAHTSPGLPALKGRASTAPTSLQHQEPRSANAGGPPGSQNTWPGPAHDHAPPFLYQLGPAPKSRSCLCLPSATTTHLKKYILNILTKISLEKCLLSLAWK